MFFALRRDSTALAIGGLRFVRQRDNLSNRWTCCARPSRVCVCVCCVLSFINSWGNNEARENRPSELFPLESRRDLHARGLRSLEIFLSEISRETSRHSVEVIIEVDSRNAAVQKIVRMKCFMSACEMVSNSVRTNVSIDWSELFSYIQQIRYLILSKNIHSTIHRKTFTPFLRIVLHICHNVRQLMVKTLRLI